MLGSRKFKTGTELLKKFFLTRGQITKILAATAAIVICVLMVRAYLRQLPSWRNQNLAKGGALFQSQIETLAGELGVPKNKGLVNPVLIQQNPSAVETIPRHGYQPQYICPNCLARASSSGATSGSSYCPNCGCPMVQVIYIGSKGSGQPPLKRVATAKEDVYYYNTIKEVIARDCARCHSGEQRNLMDYNTLKRYADTGLLMKMVEPGGPMNRFAGLDANTIIAWVKNGAPEKPEGTMPSQQQP